MTRMKMALAAAIVGFAGMFGQAQAADSMVVAMAPQLGVDLSNDGTRIAEHRDWRDYFSDISKGGIAISVEERRLSYWSPGGERFMEFPIGSPKAAEFERKGRTSVVRMKKNPTWTPTESMKQRDPSLPNFMEAGPGNPLGHRAMYLGWPAFLIHGTNAPTTIGGKVSSGCFRMFPQHVELLYENVQIGTPVYVF